MAKWSVPVVGLLMMLTCSAAFGQQGGSVQTDCQNSGDNMHCKSEYVPSPEEEFKKWQNIFGKRATSDQSKAAPNTAVPQLSPEAVKEIVEEEKKERENKNTVDFVYCRQNPKGSVTDSEGKPQACADLVEYTKAFCLVNPGVERCTLAKSKAEVEKAFAALTDDYNSDPRRQKKDVQEYFDSQYAKLRRWGCMSFPDMSLPQRDGTLSPCY